jgi:hypothetical protein
MLKKITLFAVTFMMVMGFMSPASMNEGVKWFSGNEAFAAELDCTPKIGEKLDPDCGGVGDHKDIQDILLNFATIFCYIVFGVAAIMIAYAGLKYVTSQGEPKQTEAAKMQIIAAGIGLIIAMLTFVLLGIFQDVF